MDTSGNSKPRRRASAFSAGQPGPSLRNTTPAAGDPLYLVITGDEAGKFTNAAAVTAESYTAVQVNGTFIGTKGTGSIAPVFINADAGVPSMIANAQ
jgi:hypothetical protein